MYMNKIRIETSQSYDYLFPVDTNKQFFGDNISIVNKMMNEINNLTQYERNEMKCTFCKTILIFLCIITIIGLIIAWLINGNKSAKLESSFKEKMKNVAIKYSTELKSKGFEVNTGYSLFKINELDPESDSYHAYFFEFKKVNL